MIPRSDSILQPPDWIIQLQQAVSSPADLLARLQLGAEWLAPAKSASQLFPLRVPEAFLARMELGNPNDPLLRQVLPLKEEHCTQPDYQTDPVGDLDACKTAGLIQKYHGRALIVATGACAVHCRYCFRRHFPYSDSSARKDLWKSIVKHIEQSPDLSEIILSGGDPLTLTDRRLKELLESIEAIPHIKRIRVHTRLPIVIPDRITQGLVDCFKQSRLTTVFVTHSNHANELDDAVQHALAKLSKENIQLLNQSVLLKGVNDNAASLVNLSERLFECGVLPYYLHRLDKVIGASHFDVDDGTAHHLYQHLQSVLPGYLVPKMVREVAGNTSKTLDFY